MPRSLRIAGTILAVFVASITSAHAQSTPAATPPATARAVTPPVVQGSTDVPYPEHGQGDAAVLLQLEIEKDGSVGEAHVILGAEPFAEKARRLVLTWRFTPARRGDVPIVARIRARVDFHQELVMPGAPGAPSSAGPQVPASPTAQTSGRGQAEVGVEEVNVHGSRREIGQTVLSATDVRQMPGAFGDPFRAIEALPGVIPVVSGLPFFYIRGAPPNDNAYFVDGIRVPFLFHVGIGEGVIHPALIDHVDFYPGSAPAAYGGNAGAVIVGQTRDPATTWHGEAEVRIIDSGALVEAPLDDGRFTVLAAGRYGYPGPILSAITSSVQLGYWDYQARATWRIGDRDTLGVFAFGSHDYLGAASMTNGRAGPVAEILGSDFHRVDLRYDRALVDGHLRVAATFGHDSQGGTGLGDGAAAAGVTTITNLSTAIRMEVDKKLSPTVRVRGGADVRLDDYGFAQGVASAGQNGPPQPPVPSSANPPPTNLTGGAHADVVWRVAPRVEIVPGVRVDVFESMRANGPSGTQAITTVPAVDPRLSTRVTITRSVAWLSTFGLAHQYPSLRVGGVPGMLLSVPGFPAGDSQLQTVAQASQGVEVALPWDFTLTTTGFLSGWSGLTDLTSNCIQIMPASSPAQTGNPPPTPYTCPSNQPVRGTAYGLEVLLRRPFSKRLSGWLSYTLSRSTRDEHFITPSGGNMAATVVSDYDRTHILNAIVAYDLGRRWRAGARFVFMTGAPYSNEAGNVPVPPYNAYRDPPFYRVDLRLEKRWALGKHGYFAFIAEVQNVTLSKEVAPFGQSCQGGQTGPSGPMTTQCTQPSIGPLTIPSIGVEASL
jgi:hypothetical protein